MTIEQRLEQVEQQNQRIQRTNKRLTVALTMMGVAAITIQLSACGEDPAGPSSTGLGRFPILSRPRCGLPGSLCPAPRPVSNC